MIGSQYPAPRISPRIIPGVFGFALLAACSSGSEIASSSAPSSSSAATESSAEPSRATSAQVELDFSDYRADGRCDGGERPCFQPIRSAPNPDATMLNPTHSPNGVLCAEWPYEADPTPNGPEDDCPSPVSGHELTAVCQVIGTVVTNAAGESSEIWNVYEIPETMRTADQAYGYAPALRTKDTPPLDDCKDYENPARAPLA